MVVVRSLSVGHGDMFYIRHAGDNFTIIDCHLSDDNKARIVAEIKRMAKDKGIQRFISTHPDEDHIKGLKYLDEQMPISNFYCVANSARKFDVTESFAHYCGLRDSEKAFHVFKNCKRKWMNLSDEVRGGSGLSFLWPVVANPNYQAALLNAYDGLAFNNMSLVVRYSSAGGASFLWIGDLETDFMNDIVDDINLEKTTVVFAPHHGRHSGKIPNSWLKKLDPQIIVIGEAPTRHLNYYTGYNTVTQNRAGDITLHSEGNKVHIYASSSTYGTRFDVFDNDWQTSYDHYVGSITVETEYTLDG